MKFPRILQLGALACLLGFAFMHSDAAETADMSIHGTIRPRSCSIVLSDDGAIDYGVIAPASLSESDATLLPDQTVQMTVSCAYPIRYMVHAVDNHSRKQQNDAVKKLQLLDNLRASGVVSDANVSVGAFTLLPGKGTADGAATSSLQTLNNGETWTKWIASDPLVTWPGYDDDIGWSTAGGTTPGAFTTLVEDFTVRLALAPRSRLPDLSQALAFSGSVTLSVKYL